MLKEPEKDDNLNYDLKRLGQGQNSALGFVYDKTNRQIFTLCYSFLKNYEYAEDALQDTYLAVKKNIDKFSGNNGFNWIYTISKNICLNKLKNINKEISVDFGEEKTVNMFSSSQIKETEIKDESGIIALAGRTLDGNEYKIVMLHAVGGFKFKDIARIVKKLETTVRWQYNNAIRKLRLKFNEENKQ